MKDAVPLVLGISPWHLTIGVQEKSQLTDMPPVVALRLVGRSLGLIHPGMHLQALRAGS